MSEPVKITWGGQQWPVPKLVWKQLRIVLPALTGLFGTIKAAGGDAMLSSFGLEQIDLVGNAVFTAINAGTPSFTRADFDKLEVDFPTEMLPAVLAVAAQAGMSKQSPAPVGSSAPVGEEAAASQ